MRKSIRAPYRDARLLSSIELCEAAQCSYLTEDLSPDDGHFPGILLLRRFCLTPFSTALAY